MSSYHKLIPHPRIVAYGELRKVETHATLAIDPAALKVLSCFTVLYALIANIVYSNLSETVKNLQECRILPISQALWLCGVPAW
jgi:hypothetical protein